MANVRYTAWTTHRNYTAEEKEAGIPPGQDQIYDADEFNDLAQTTDNNASILEDVLPVEFNFINSEAWIANHGKNGFPTVICMDEAGRQLQGGNPEYTDRDTVIVRFNSPQTGTMRLF